MSVTRLNVAALRPLPPRTAAEAAAELAALPDHRRLDAMIEAMIQIHRETGAHVTDAQLIAKGFAAADCARWRVSAGPMAAKVMAARNLHPAEPDPSPRAGHDANARQPILGVSSLTSAGGGAAPANPPPAAFSGSDT